MSRSVLTLAMLLTLSCSCGKQKPEKEPPAVPDTDDIVEIKTPNGKRGVYCKGMADYGGKSDRANCYRFVSVKCPSGYTFIRESQDAVMIECKPPEFGE